MNDELTVEELDAQGDVALEAQAPQTPPTPQPPAPPTEGPKDDYAPPYVPSAPGLGAQNPSERSFLDDPDAILAEHRQGIMSDVAALLANDRARAAAETRIAYELERRGIDSRQARMAAEQASGFLQPGMINEESVMAVTRMAYGNISFDQPIRTTTVAPAGPSVTLEPAATAVQGRITYRPAPGVDASDIQFTAEQYGVDLNDPAQKRKFYADLEREGYLVRG